jgi:hypothetical protein
MKVRHKQRGNIADAFEFNTSAVAPEEIIVQFDDGSADSDYLRDYDVLIGGAWKDMRQAFKDHDLIRDNHNTRFFEPRTEENRARGYAL